MPDFARALKKHLSINVYSGTQWYAVVRGGTRWYAVNAVNAVNAVVRAEKCDPKKGGGVTKVLHFVF